MKKPILIVVLMMGTTLLLGQSSDVSRHTVLRTSDAPKIDGNLNDPVWQKATPLRFVHNVTAEPDQLGTWAKVAYDDQFLYFAFQVEDVNIWSTYTERDQHLWTEEVVEVFIQADPEHPNYIELEVNPLGTMLDIYLINIRKPIPYKSWNSARLQWGIQVDGTVDGEGGDRSWSCEMALPHEDVITAPNIPPKPGDQWRMNLYRVDSRPAKAGLAWSPTRKPDFHVPSMFGIIEFGE